MELELKHLAPYLPYGLNGVWVDGSSKLFDFQLVGFKGTTNASKINPIWAYTGDKREIVNRENCTPILRPLSDLTKEIEYNGEKFVPAEKIDLLTDGRIWLIKDERLEWSGGEGQYREDIMLIYEVLQKLFEWHIDVFRLIDADLAIDINTENT